MQPETVRYLIEIVTAKRDHAHAMCMTCSSNAPLTKQHWSDELRRANDAYAELARMPIA